ncbi:MAG: phospholipid scramblase-related protein [Nocardioidaceae bacterium]
MSTTLLQHSVFVVEQRKQVFEMDTNYDILDADGHTIGTVRQVGQSAARKVFRLVAKMEEYLEHKFEVTDTSGTVILRLQRPAKLRKSRLVVSDADGSEIGEIAQLNNLGKVRFGLTSGGQPIGELRGKNIRDRSFTILDVSENPVGRVSKKLEGMKGILRTEDTYAVQVDAELDGPLRMLSIAAGIGLDLALHQTGDE